MNGKKGLSRFMSALLAASSMIGGASADTKKKTKEPNGAGVVFNNENGGRRGERKKRLDFSSTKSGVVGLIKEHPKTFAGLGLAGLSAIGYVGYRVYNDELNRIYNDELNRIYNDELNRMYREMFSKKNYDSICDLSCCSVRFFPAEKTTSKKGGLYAFEKSIYAGNEKLCEIYFCVGDSLDDVKVIVSRLLKVVIFAYFCERMVKVHPEWSYLISLGKNGPIKYKMINVCSYFELVEGELGMWFEVELYKQHQGPDRNEKVCLDLCDAMMWGRFLGGFCDKYFEELKRKVLANDLMEDKIVAKLVNARCAYFGLS